RPAIPRGYGSAAQQIVHERPHVLRVDNPIPIRIACPRTPRCKDCVVAVHNPAAIVDDQTVVTAGFSDNHWTYSEHRTVRARDTHGIDQFDIVFPPLVTEVSIPGRTDSKRRLSRSAGADV